MAKKHCIDFSVVRKTVPVRGHLLPATLFRPAPYDSSSFRMRHYIFLIYGGGLDNTQEKVFALAEYFATRNIGVVCFDFWGNTHDTKDRFYESGIYTRVEDAKRVFASCVHEWMDDGTRTILGFSMGGYVAVHLVAWAKKACLNVRNLVLVAPGAFHPDAYKKKIPFGPQFKELILPMTSWENSDGFKLIKEFTGDILVIHYARDEIVFDIPRRYYEHATASGKIIHELPYFEHKGTYEGKKMEDIADFVHHWVKNRLSPKRA